MENVSKLMAVVRGVLTRTALKDAVASKPISAGDQHVLVLSDVSVGLGAGGGGGADSSKRKQTGTGAAGGGGAKAKPVAVVVVDRGEIRIDQIG